MTATGHATKLDLALDAFVARKPKLPLAIAYSGGADSSALLAACAQRFPQQVLAWHINHGLQDAASCFEAHCHRQCQRLGIPLQVLRIDARHAPGESPEDAARKGRYRAMTQLARQSADSSRPVTSVALAQHADDQVETLLLALSRGAGLPGLAGMPAHWQGDGIAYWRPLLPVSKADILAWLQQQGLNWVEDPSNQRHDYTRNRIRLELLPMLQAMFPACHRTFARSARHAAQAQLILDEVAAQDLAECGLPPQIALLQALSLARQANALRHWLASHHQTQASTAQLQELQKQILACTNRGQDIRLRIGSGRVERIGPRIRWCSAQNS